MSGVLTKEMEFEFTEEPGTGAARFQTTSNVRGVIARHLAQGDLDAAATLIATSAPEIGDALFEDVQDASVAVKSALAEAFIRARDFDRAGRAALLTGDPARAASFFERSYRFDEAAGLYEKAGQLERAAELFVRGLDFARAAGLYERAGNLEAAAEAYGNAGKHLAAGRIWMRVRRLDRALETLQQVDASSEDFAQAVYALGRILEHTGHRDAAVTRYIELVKSRPASVDTVDVYERLAEIYIAVNELRPARKLLERVLTFDPSREKARQLLSRVPAQPRVATTTDPNGPARISVSMAPPAMSFTASPSMPPPSLGVAGTAGIGGTPSMMPGPNGVVPPLVLPPPPGGAAPESVRVTAVHKDVDTLRNLPLFSELSLDELRALHEIGERARFAPGALIIEQGQAGTQLLVLVSGTVSVIHVTDDGREHELVQLGYGASLGEMALVDEGPTSARVRAATDVAAFRWQLDKLRRHLAAHEGTALRILRVMSRTLSVRLRETNRRVGGDAAG